MLYSAMENLVNNAWKYQGGKPQGHRWSSGCTGMSSPGNPMGWGACRASGAGSGSPLSGIMVPGLI